MFYELPSSDKLIIVIVVFIYKFLGSEIKSSVTITICGHKRAVTIFKYFQNILI